MQKIQSTVFITLLVLLLGVTLARLTVFEVSAQGANPEYINKPVFPVKINASQIPIGNNWTLIYNLQANTTYHAYFYGRWINNGSEPKTDYDVYVYNPLGALESVHTEAAGLPEHLGDNVSYPFFTPKMSGNYSFVIRNDPRESQAAEAATFMLIPHVETNKWYQQPIQGKVNDLPTENTSWAFEFATTSKNIEIKVQVPDTLDMYEVRLYLLANSAQGKGTKLNNVSLAWAPGLYGNRSGLFGGYNLDSKMYRGIAYASCEYPGQDMFINYTSPYDGESLYHLVFIGENGAGTVNFAVKTDFKGPSISVLNVPQRVFPEQQCNLTFSVNSKTELANVSMRYSVDNWNTSQTVSLLPNINNVFNASIPAQQAGTRVTYNITVTDVMHNRATYRNSYTVKHATATNATLRTNVLGLGKNITLSGFVTPAEGNLSVTVIFTPNNGSVVQRHVLTLANGTFYASFMPNITGKWTVEATFEEDGLHFGSASEAVEFLVVEEGDFFASYSIYIYGAVGVVAAVVVVVVVMRRRSG
ncbi:MAG: hypothetical protein ACQXXH_01405 [Candidatus Bathyarchaeia archaeon]|jgi:hypothetical protein|nr:hypothetical protein [Candidatus Bathyarchaeota archaeon A05DMB-4]MDH7596109.1 hypothetical protein [Candidatus Bathyarchaeota archaeon]